MISLRERLRRYRPGKALPIGRLLLRNLPASQLLSALHYAHNCRYRDVDGTIKQSIVHGDVKPQNNFLDRSTDSVKLADFMIPDVQAFLGEENHDFRESGQLYIGKFNSVVSNLNATGQNELADALKTLKDAIMASQHLPEDKKEEQVEVINQIGEEAAKPKPNKTLLKMLGDGLMATLKVIPDVAGAVAAVAPMLAQLHI